MNIALLLPLLQALPTLVESGFKVYAAVKDDPGTPDEVKVELEAISARLNEIVERVKTLRWL